MNDSEGFKTSVEKVTADVMETEREQEFEAKPEHVTKLTQSHGKALTDEGFFLMDEQKKWFLEKKSIPGEDTVKVKVVSHVQLFASHGQAPLSCQAPLSTGHNY